MKGIIGTMIGVAAIGAACTYGGMRYQQYSDSIRPYDVVSREGVYLFLDKKESKEFDASSISETYSRLESVSSQLESKKEEIEEIKGRLNNVKDRLRSIDELVE